MKDCDERIQGAISSQERNVRRSVSLSLEVHTLGQIGDKLLDNNVLRLTDGNVGWLWRRTQAAKLAKNTLWVFWEFPITSSVICNIKGEQLLATGLLSAGWQVTWIPVIDLTWIDNSCQF